MTDNKGIFIAIEGIDGAGTTTFMNLLADFFRTTGHETLVTCEPSAGRVGRLIREMLKSSEGMHPEASTLALMFAADRVEHWNFEIKPAIERGAVVISDRYLLSSLAYQGSVENSQWVLDLNSRVPWPDLTFFFRIPPHIAWKRLEKRNQSREILELPDFQVKVSEAYEKHLNLSKGLIFILNAELTPAEILEQATSFLQEHSLI